MNFTRIRNNLNILILNLCERGALRWKAAVCHMYNIHNMYSNATARHLKEHNHQIGWDNAMCLEKEKKIIPKEDFRKHINKRKQTKVHEFKRLNRGEYIRKGEGDMAEEGKTRYIKRKQRRVYFTFNLKDEVGRTVEISSKQSFNILKLLAACDELKLQNHLLKSFSD